MFWFTRKRFVGLYLGAHSLGSSFRMPRNRSERSRYSAHQKNSGIQHIPASLGERFRLLVRKARWSPTQARTAVLRWQDAFPLIEIYWPRSISLRTRSAEKLSPALSFTPRVTSGMYRTSWTLTIALAQRWLPQPRALHRFPDARFAATIRDKNGAPVRVRGGGREQSRSLLRSTVGFSATYRSRKCHSLM